ncbi:MAG: hypothetical protein Q7V62_13525, partial [Actinomycetota bacterium]|nr:hypothetical protein [Actinomycetota bacterium]
PLTDRIGTYAMYDYACYSWGAMVDLYASNPERVWDGLLEMPVEKRPAFLNSLRLLAESDPRARRDAWGHKTLGRPGFDRALFDGMNADASMASETFGVDVRHAVKRRREAGIGEPLSEEGERFMRAQQRRRGTDGLALDDSLVEEHKDTTAMVDIAPARDARSRTRDAGAALVRMVPTGTPVAVTLTDYTQRIEELRGATDDQRLALMHTLVRVATAQLLKITGVKQSDLYTKLQVDAGLGSPLGAQLAPALVVHFVPVLAQQQTQLALGVGLSDQTPLEREAAKRDPASIADVAIVTPGWWNPSNPSGPTALAAQEDGQVRIALGAANDTATSIGLPHDSFAATLAAHHDVVFAGATPVISASSGVKTPVFGPGLKQSRTDALVWSILLSYVANGHIKAGTPAVAGGAAATGTQLRDEIKARLERVWKRRGATVTPLACQAHMFDVINAATTTLREIVSYGFVAGGTCSYPAVFPLAVSNGAVPPAWDTTARDAFIAELTKVLEQGEVAQAPAQPKPATPLE